jgi:TonB family protein
MIDRNVTRDAGAAHGAARLMAAAAVIAWAACASDAVAQYGLSSSEMKDFANCALQDHVCMVITGKEVGGRDVWELIEEKGGKSGLSGGCLAFLGGKCNKIYGIAIEAWGESRFYREKATSVQATLAYYRAEKRAKVAQAERTKMERVKADVGRARLETKEKGGKEFTDKRDGKKYLAVKTGDLSWMAQNLNYKPSNGSSWCYENNNFNCDAYGRLYNWKTAKSACPAGWRLPTVEEWDYLSFAVGGMREYSKGCCKGSDYVWRGAGAKLKATSGWDSYIYDAYNGNGTNGYGFSALPSGSRNVDGDFVGIGTNTDWWAVSDNDVLNYRGASSVDYLYENSKYDEGEGFSVRCVQGSLSVGSSPGGSSSPLEKVDDADIRAIVQARVDSVVQAANRKGNVAETSGTQQEVKSGAPTGRTSTSIQHVIRMNMAALRYEYNKRLRQKPGMAGKITVSFAIDEFGKVISASVVESTMNDSVLEKIVADNVKGWRFDAIDKPGDVATVTYPFLFETGR